MSAGVFILSAMTRAVFPGSFDPPTNGHINIIERVKNIFSEIHVVIAVNGDKRCLFSADERCSMLRRLTERWSNVSVHLCDTLVVEYAKKNNANVLIRGIRSVSDFSYEFELSVMNQSLNPDIETFFMSPDPRYFVLRSSAIKEIASYGGDVSAMVPDCVARALKEKFKFSAE